MFCPHRVLQSFYLRVALTLYVILLALTATPTPALAKSCVWKVTSGPHTLYLAGSVHALRPSDYPLPATYDQAFAASQELVFETEPGASASSWTRRMGRAAELPAGKTLRDVVDPRTYAYLQRVLARVHGSTEPEKKIAHLRPWALAWILESPNGARDLSGARGVDNYLELRGGKAGKRLSGLVSLSEHINVLGNMSDRDGELMLLLGFIQLDTAGETFARNVAAWKRGDTAAIDAGMRREYRDAPSVYQHLLTDRNQLWLPKLERYLAGGPTRMVVAGAAHMSGPDGLPAQLAARGYRVEQL